MKPYFNYSSEILFGSFIYILSIFIYEQFVKQNWKALKPRLQTLNTLTTKIQTLSPNEPIILSFNDSNLLRKILKDLKLQRFKMYILKASTFLFFTIALRPFQFQKLFNKFFPNPSLQDHEFETYLPFYSSILNFLIYNIEVPLGLLMTIILSRIRVYQQRRKFYYIFGLFMIITGFIAFIIENLQNESHNTSESNFQKYSQRVNQSLLSEEKEDIKTLGMFEEAFQLETKTVHKNHQDTVEPFWTDFAISRVDFNDTWSPLLSPRTSEDTRDVTISSQSLHIDHKTKQSKEKKENDSKVDEDKNFNLKVNMVIGLLFILMLGYIFFKEYVELIMEMLICVGMLELIRYLLNWVHRGIGNNFCGLLITITAEYLLRVEP